MVVGFNPMEYYRMVVDCIALLAEGEAMRVLEVYDDRGIVQCQIRLPDEWTFTLHANHDMEADE